MGPLRSITYDADHMNTLVVPASLQVLLPEGIAAACEGGRYERNALVFARGQRPVWMFYVVSGEVVLERASDPGEAVILQRTRGGFVSEASLRTERYHCDARATGETVVIKVPVAALVAGLERDPAFALRWIDMLNAEVRHLRSHCERLALKSVRARLLHLIRSEGKGGRYAMPYGLKTLAAELGVSHEALYRTVAALEAEGRVARAEGALVLGD